MSKNIRDGVSIFRADRKRELLGVMLICEKANFVYENLLGFTRRSPEGGMISAYPSMLTS